MCYSVLLNDYSKGIRISLLEVSDGLADEDYEVILKESYEKVGEYTQVIGFLQNV
ncbi:MAG: hypothetical protein HRT53_20450 [Colwellia sp.]|nr:hypothetical protein [Colwellia sp.]